MRLDHAWIEEHIPHQGRMCLLDEVIAWDAERISCRSGTHRAADHPLRAHGRLGIACGIEYAAQAMAVHGALIAGALDIGPDGPARPAAGLLASVRGVRFHVLRLDDVRGDLICDAVRVAGDRSRALYEFELRSGAACLLSGRATVVLDADERVHL
jgi:predicted hotdog family 3-hydroxylacyl-ACP dehydratase